MTSNFPPIGVVKGGDDVPNTMKSDPDDVVDGTVSIVHHQI